MVADFASCGRQQLDLLDQPWPEEAAHTGDGGVCFGDQFRLDATDGADLQTQGRRKDDVALRALLVVHQVPPHEALAQALARSPTLEADPIAIKTGVGVGGANLNSG